jgi:hypothetical protein
MEKQGLGGFGKSGYDMFRIAVNLAGFDKTELMLEICKIQSGRDNKISEHTILKAMDIVYKRYQTEPSSLGILADEFLAKLKKQDLMKGNSNEKGK